MQRPPHAEFSLTKTSPKIVGSGVVTSTDKTTCTYDLVEQMHYLYVRIVKAKDLPSKDITSGCDPYVEVKLGNYKGVTRHFEKNVNPEWNHVFAFSEDRLQSLNVEISVKDKDCLVDDFIGKITFELIEVPRRLPPDSPLAPQWYKLEKKGGEKIKHGEIMVAVWKGTQADEAFPDAWHSDSANVTGQAVSKIRGKVYVAPKLWYVRVTVIDCQDLVPSEKGKIPNVCVRVNIGNQLLKTKLYAGVDARWNEELVFVTAEPFEDLLVINVVDIMGSKEEIMGRFALQLQNVHKRSDAKFPALPKWHNLEKHLIIEEGKKDKKSASKIRLRTCLEGGYHVLDEFTHYSSDLRPTSKQLWKSSIGLLELGIISAKKLSPMKSKDGLADAFCVAKYGQKWVRTRTIIGSISPSWNEQYTWEVFDPCTVITICVFENGHFQGGGKDFIIGKVRIRLSTLETDRVYTHFYPLIVLQKSGVKKMGEIQLALRFSCTSFFNTLRSYAHPLLPKMHYTHPLSIRELDSLRYHATNIVSSRLNRAEPPLKKEVVEYMLDVGNHIWSVRRSKAHYERVKNFFDKFIAIRKWFDQICHWKNPLTTILIHVLFVILVFNPEFILPTIFLYLFFIGIWRYRLKPRHPSHMDVCLSHADKVGPDELDEEFDSFPTTKGSEVVKRRYDRLRIIGGRIQTVVGDLATQGERFESLLNWRDPRASGLFVTFCFVLAIVVYITPFQVLALISGFYVLRHPRFRDKLPSLPINFFRRLPAKTDCML